MIVSIPMGVFSQIRTAILIESRFFSFICELLKYKDFQYIHMANTNPDLLPGLAFLCAQMDDVNYFQKQSFASQVNVYDSFLPFRMWDTGLRQINVQNYENGNTGKLYRRPTAAPQIASAAGT